jgi:hypothetical protein
MTCHTTPPYLTKCPDLSGGQEIRLDISVFRLTVFFVFPDSEFQHLTLAVITDSD